MQGRDLCMVVKNNAGGCALSLLASYLLGCLDESFPEMKGCACLYTHTQSRQTRPVCLCFLPARPAALKTISSSSPPPLFAPLRCGCTFFVLLYTDIAQGQTKKERWPKNKLLLLTPKKHWRSLSNGAAHANVTHAGTTWRDFNGCYVTWWSQGCCSDSSSRGWGWINNGRTEVMSPVETKCYRRRTGEPVPFRYSLPLGTCCQDDAADC